MKPLRFLLAAAALLTLHLGHAANTKETVEQVSQTVTLTADVDYIVSSATPFATAGIVNIENTEHAVLILKSVKPQAAQSLLGTHVQIAGQRAVIGQNCQVKIYNRGCIVLPYGDTARPLTVYSGQNFEGEACNSFGLESSGGFMNTLTDAKLNNRIRSFRLKRGYMVTFSLLKEGRGYSRCFIAADSDLEMATLPAIMDRSISSYRIFKWYDTGKPALANDTRAEAVAALNVTSCYSFGPGESRLPNAECVPHHIHEGWPSPASLGQCTYSPHMKTNNEPRNNSDDQPATLDQILANWQELMRTGMRLCSPSSWDGSDYWNGTGFLKEFFDSIDARGWRCDIVDLHCYWPEGNFANVKNWTSSVHRPVWISEWCWGASWNSNGAFANGVTENQVRDALQRICSNLNSYDCVERYYYWNSERDISKIYRNGALTPAGKMYAQLDGGVGYNGKYDYTPRAPKQQDPKALAVVLDKESNTVSVGWQEYNGEMNEYILLERRKSKTDNWETAMEITDIESAGLYSYNGIEGHQGWEFRIAEKDANGKLRYSNTATALSSGLEAGDAIEMNGKTMYLGGNVVANSNFAMGTTGWTNGAGEPIGQPWFQVVPMGGSDGGAFLQCYGHGGRNTEQSLKTLFNIAPHQDYYFQADACNTNSIFNMLTLSADGSASDSTVANVINATAIWQPQYAVFNSGRFASALFSCYNLGCKTQMGNVLLCPLFNTRDEAMTQAAAAERQRSLMVMEYAPQWANWLQGVLAGKADTDEQDYLKVKAANEEAIRAARQPQALTELWQQAESLVGQYPMPGYETLDALCRQVPELLETNDPAELNRISGQLSEALMLFLPMTVVEGAVTNPDFMGSAGWQTKAGTYKGGDQRQNTIDGISCWNAWWDVAPDDSQLQSMAIRQQTDQLEHGLYAVSCQAATQHFCLTDQHAYISNGTDSLVVMLDADWLDLNIDAASKWQMLTSLPLYVGDGGSVSIGFESSKQGANDLAWRQVGNTSSKGDHREGWWVATNFRLLFHPLYRATTVPGVYGVSCLPYAVAPSPGVKFYQIAAITADYQTLCLEEIDEVEAGVPFIYMADGSLTSFMEHGTAAAKAQDGPGNLRGYLKTTAASRIPLNYYALNEGRWQKITDSANRPHTGDYTAAIRPFDDKNSKRINVVDHWDGPTMPIEGVTQEEIAAGLGGVYGNGATPATTFYNLSGQPTTTAQPGVYIKVVNGRAIKTVVR